MCGINGFNFEDKNLIQIMNQKLNHRGPDGRNYFVQEGLSLGHSRLSIIDISDAGTQPMMYQKNKKKLSIVFNGEIYNYIELKNILIQLGYEFFSSSDTEVIMAAYLEWGESCVSKFNGMWSFCIYDFENQILFCSRDRLGVKPFYYYIQDNKFIFSSELKSILSHEELNIPTISNIDHDAVDLYFSLGYIPAPYTIYKNVFKLLAGSNLIFNLRDSLIRKIYSYYSVPNKKDNINKDELLEEGKHILRDSVGLRMRSDVPVGAFLSGGLDSSTVVGEMRHFCDIKNLHTFSIGFDNKNYDESNYIDIVKNHFRTQHHHHIFNEQDFNSIWSDYSYIFDEPFGDYSSFPSYKVCNMARQNVTVSLSGDGGDEIFGGYPIYNTGFILEKIKVLPLKLIKLLFKATSSIKNTSPHLLRLNELLKLSMHEPSNFYNHMFSESRYKPSLYNDWTSEKMAEALEISGNNIGEALRIYDLLNNTLSDNYLVKVDRTSMANSIEVRSPFLDFRFIEFSQKIPTSLKFNLYGNKILMREIIKDILPKSIIKRNKMGFTPPIDNWLYQNISDQKFLYYKNYLKQFNPDLHEFYELKLISEKNSYIKDLYMIRLVIFGNWFETWIKNS